jgi:hypothetical protein
VRGESSRIGPFAQNGAGSGFAPLPSGHFLSLIRYKIVK